MSKWTTEELSKIETAEELNIASMQRDGTLRKPLTIWVVRHGDQIYVRSVGGPNGGWFRGTQTRHRGHIRAGSVAKDVSFVSVDADDVGEEIDAAYRAKYRRYPAGIINSVLTPQARAATLELVPNDP
jgi:hypothetical protein